MSEPHDETLAALGAIERDYERRHPGRWEAVIAGEAAADEVAAERAAIDPPAEHAVFQEMFGRAASEAEIEALVGRAAQVLAGGAARQVGAVAGSEGASAVGAASGAVARSGEAGAREVGAVARSSEVGAAGEGGVVARSSEAGPASEVGAARSGAAEEGKVVSLASRRRAPAIVAAALAIAAAVLLWRFTVTPAFAPGGYTLTLRDTAVSAVRSSDPAAEVRRYASGSELDWVLSPEREGSAAIELRALATGPEGREVLVTPVFTRTPAGALRIRGRVAEVLPLPPGRWRLVFVAAPAGAAPTSAAEAGRAATIGRAVEVEIAE